MIDVKRAINTARQLVSANSHTFLLASGTAGFLGTIYLTARAAPEAKIRLETRERFENKTEDLYSAIKAIAPVYGPVAAIGGISLGCFYASNHIVTKRNAVLAAAASLSERALLEYQEQVIGKLGEAAHGDILEAVAANTDEEVFDPANFTEGDGDTLCFDKVTGRYFTSSPSKIREAESFVVKQCADEVTAKLNDFYYALGLEDISLIGEAVGWDVGKVKPDIRFSSMLDSNKRPCLVLNYHVCMLNRGTLLERVW